MNLVKKINKLHRPLDQLTKRNKSMAQINRIRSEQGNYNTHKIQNIIKECFKNMFSIK